MAEIISNKNKKGSPRIDLTPMVDLGFLLITFFVFTSSMSKPKTMDIKMPAIGGAPTEIAHHTAMTIFLVKAHALYYYSGIDAMNHSYEKLQQTTFAKNGIRNALITHVANVKNAFISGLKGSTQHDFPFIIIKPGRDSEYSDLVDLLDELTIAGIRNYALVDLESKEEKSLESKL